MAAGGWQHGKVEVGFSESHTSTGGDGESAGRVGTHMLPTPALAASPLTYRWTAASIRNQQARGIVVGGTREKVKKVAEWMQGRKRTREI